MPYIGPRYDPGLPYWLGNQSRRLDPRPAPRVCSMCGITLRVGNTPALVPHGSMCRDCHSVYNTVNPTVENPVGVLEGTPRARRASKPKAKAKPRKKQPTKTPKAKLRKTAWDRILKDDLLG